jgi:hypothetical protein
VDHRDRLARSALVALALGLKDWFFRPRLRLVLGHASDPDETSDRILTKRLETAETAAFVRLRLDNRGRSTARNVGVRVFKMHRWDTATASWIRSRPELDGRLLQPSNQLASEPDLVDVFPYSDRIVDLASVDHGRTSQGKSPIFVEIQAMAPFRRLHRPARQPGARFSVRTRFARDRRQLFEPFCQIR